MVLIQIIVKLVLNTETERYETLLQVLNTNNYLGKYDGRSISSRTVLLSKHTVTAENQNYYEVVLPLLCNTYRGLIYDLMLRRHYY